MDHTNFTTFEKTFQAIFEEHLHRTSTMCDARGGFSGMALTEVTCVLTRSEAVRLRNHLHLTQPGTFMTIVSTSEIVGRGFRNV